MIELMHDDPAPFLWLFFYLVVGGAIAVAIGVAVLKWFKAVIGSDDLADYLYLDRPRTIRVEIKADSSEFVRQMSRAESATHKLEQRLGRRREYTEDPSTGLLVGRWVDLEVPDE